jgi:hypothetical protein
MSSSRGDWHVPVVSDHEVAAVAAKFQISPDRYSTKLRKR